MKILKILARGIIAFFLSIFFCLIFGVTLLTATMVYDESSTLVDILTLIWAIVDIILPLVIVIMTIITEVKIEKLKLKDELNENIKDKYNLDKNDLKKECQEYFCDFIKYLYHNDDTGMKRILSGKYYDTYMSIYDDIAKKKLSDKYTILEYRLTNIEDKNGVLFINYDIKVLHGLYFFTKFSLNKRKMIYYSFTYSYTPIINEKNCHNCGSTLKNTYRCLSCDSKLKYDEHILKIEQIEFIKEIDRWC